MDVAAEAVAGVAGGNRPGFGNRAALVVGVVGRNGVLAGNPGWSTLAVRYQAGDRPGFA